MPTLLRLQGVSKSYPGVRALSEVNFELRPGEVHCLVGENGAGKSTLMKILSGALAKDSGEIAINGIPVQIHSPSDALKHGIGIIYQDFKLVPELSAAENIYLGKEPLRAGFPFIDSAAMRDRAGAQLALLGEEFDSALPVRMLSVAQQQIVEIAKAISQKVKILALDEPSAPLTGKELVKLFAIIRRLTSEGVGVIYISHRLEEIFQIGHRVTVLRDGKVVASCPVAETEKSTLIQWMVGRDLEDEYPPATLTTGEELLRVEDVHAGILAGINFSLHRGEILGFAGLVGAGRTELARVIFAADAKGSGRIFLDGEEIRPRSPREAIDLGIGLLTEDRNRLGLIPEMNVIENVTLSSLSDLVRGPFLDTAKENRDVQRLIEKLHIKTQGGNKPVENLSGGNRQKVILARWLLKRSRVLIFDEPTAGIDVGAKYEIYSLINALAQEGVGIMMISSDLPELLGICTRIIVMRDGTIAGEFGRSEATQEKIMAMATGLAEVSYGR